MATLLEGCSASDLMWHCSVKQRSLHHRCLQKTACKTSRSLRGPLRHSATKQSGPLHFETLKAEQARSFAQSELLCDQGVHADANNDLIVVDSLRCSRRLLAPGESVHAGIDSYRCQLYTVPLTVTVTVAIRHLHGSRLAQWRLFSSSCTGTGQLS